MARNIGISLEGLGIKMPYNIQAEQSVLGAALMDASHLDTISQRLRPEMFFVRQNRVVMAEMLALAAASKPVDAVTLLDRLAQDPAFPSDAEVKEYIGELADTMFHISNLSHYIDIVYEKYIKRQLMEHAREILEQAEDDIETGMMLEGAEQRLYDIRAGQETGEVQHLKYGIIDIMTHLQRISGPDKEKYLGLKTGFTYLDKVLTGLAKSDLVILASRPGMGKTSFALNIMMNVAQRDVPVMFFSLEMTKDQLAARVLSFEAQVDSHIFRSGVSDDSVWRDLTMTSERLSSRPVFLDDSSLITVAEMKSKMRQQNQQARAAGRPPIGLVIIDYLQLMSTGKRSENRVQEVSEMTRNLKIMAKDLNVPILVLSQLSRSPEKSRGGDRRPMLSDLRDSGSIEQDADIVMFLYRESYYDDSPEVDRRNAQCIVAKNRHGETGTIELAWDGEHTRFYERDLARE